MELLKLALIVAGVLHFGLLTASFSVPRVLHWDEELKKLDPFSRQIVLVHGAFIVLTVVAFGSISLVTADALLAGSVLGLALAGFIAVFWLTRLLIQVFYYDAQPHLTTPFRRVGFRALTVLFAYFSVVYFAAAWVNWRAVW